MLKGCNHEMRGQSRALGPNLLKEGEGRCLGEALRQGFPSGRGILILETSLFLLAVVRVSSVQAEPLARCRHKYIALRCL